MHEEPEAECPWCRLDELEAQLERDRQTHGSGLLRRDRQGPRIGRRQVEDVPGL